MLKYISTRTNIALLKEKAGQSNEVPFILVKYTWYLGFGFLDEEETINSQVESEYCSIAQKDDVDIEKILLK